MQTLTPLPVESPHAHSRVTWTGHSTGSTILSAGFRPGDSRLAEGPATSTVTLLRCRQSALRRLGGAFDECLGLPDAVVVVARGEVDGD